MKLEVWLNREMICRAGPTSGFAYLCAELTQRIELEQGKRTVTCKLGVAANSKDDFAGGRRKPWALRDVGVGDVIRVRLVEHGELTEPEPVADKTKGIDDPSKMIERLLTRIGE